MSSFLAPVEPLGASDEASDSCSRSISSCQTSKEKDRHGCSLSSWSQLVKDVSAGVLKRCPSESRQLEESVWLRRVLCCRRSGRKNSQRGVLNSEPSVLIPKPELTPSPKIRSAAFVYATGCRSDYEHRRSVKASSNETAGTLRTARGSRDFQLPILWLVSSSDKDRHGCTFCLRHSFHQ